jgi:hypothetical protein
MSALVVLALAVVMGALTWLSGWWAVLGASCIAGAACHRRRRCAGLVAGAAAVAWGALLLADARDGRLGTLAAQLGGVFPVPGPGLLLLTVLFIAAGAWSAAVVGAAVADRIRGDTAV